MGSSLLRILVSSTSRAAVALAGKKMAADAAKAEAKVDPEANLRNKDGKCLIVVLEKVSTGLRVACRGLRS
jgi:hypothetical protein